MSVVVSPKLNSSSGHLVVSGTEGQCVTGTPLDLSAGVGQEGEELGHTPTLDKLYKEDKRRYILHNTVCQTRIEQTRM